MSEQTEIGYVYDYYAVRHVDHCRISTHYSQLNNTCFMVSNVCLFIGDNRQPFLLFQMNASRLNITTIKLLNGIDLCV